MDNLERKRKTKIKRVIAEESLRGVRARVEQINQGQLPFAYVVSRFAVFGSYLTEADKIGDLDVAIELSPRDPSTHDKQFLERANDPNRPARFSGISAYYWPIEEVYRFIKDRDQRVSVHPFAELADLKCPYTVVLGKEPPLR